MITVDKRLASYIKNHGGSKFASAILTLSLLSGPYSANLNYYEIEHSFGFSKPYLDSYGNACDFTEPDLVDF